MHGRRSWRGEVDFGKGYLPLNLFFTWNEMGRKEKTFYYLKKIEEGLWNGNFHEMKGHMKRKKKKKKRRRYLANKLL